LPDGKVPGGDLQLREIRGGRYAVTLHVGPYAELHFPYTWLYGTWLPKSGEEAARCSEHRGVPERRARRAAI
jgi:DNA gyrase inhibitor GyrI